MSISSLREELLVASNALRELNTFIIMLRSARITSWHQTRCGRCEQHTFLTLHHHQYPYRQHRTAMQQFASSSFEILDGFCTICANDDLWGRLCRIDPTRDPARSAFDPYSHKEAMCPVCLGNTFNGILRGNVWSGACDDCHALYASPQLRRSVRKNLANMSRARRELRSRIRLLNARINRLIETTAIALDDSDVITLPPPSSR